MPFCDGWAMAAFSWLVDTSAASRPTQRTLSSERRTEVRLTLQMIQRAYDKMAVLSPDVALVVDGDQREVHVMEVIGGAEVNTMSFEGVF